MATYSNILAWRIPWTEESGGLQSMGSQKSDMAEQLTHTYVLIRSLLMGVISLLKDGDFHIG